MRAKKYPYPLVQKAYWVGSQDELRMIGHPECGAELISIGKDEPRNEAKKAIQMWMHDDIYSFIDIRMHRAKEYDLYEYEGQTLTKSDIWERERSKAYKKEIKNILDRHKGKNCYIYSGEHGAYWRRNSAGYTTQIKDVGVYSVEDACSIAFGCDASKQLELQIIE